MVIHQEAVEYACFLRPSVMEMAKILFVCEVSGAKKLLLFSTQTKKLLTLKIQFLES